MVGQSPRVVTTAWSRRAPLYWNGPWHSGMVGLCTRKITTRWSHSHCRPTSPLGWRLHVVEIRTKTYWYSGIVAWFGQNARVVTTVWLWRAPRYWHARLVYWYGWFVGRVDHPEYENALLVFRNGEKRGSGRGHFRVPTFQKSRRKRQARRTVNEGPPRAKDGRVSRHAPAASCCCCARLWFGAVCFRARCRLRRLPLASC